MNKRVLLLLPFLLAFLLLAGIPAVYADAEGVGASGENAPDGEFQYRLRLDPRLDPPLSVEITGYQGGSDSFLKTPAELGGFPVTAIGAEAFKDNNTLTAISVQEGVTEIGEQAFYRCSKLRTVSLPEGLTSIGNLAFSGCFQLERVVIPDSVQNFGLFLFPKGSDVTVQVGRGSAAERYCQENGLSYTNLSVREESDREIRNAVFEIFLYLVMLGPMLLASLLVRNNDLKIGVCSTSLGLEFVMIIFLIAQDGLDGNELPALIFLLLSTAAVSWGLYCFWEGIRTCADTARQQRIRNPGCP